MRPGAAPAGAPWRRAPGASLLRRWAAATLAVGASAEVSCGARRALHCAECAPTHNRSDCEGDCRWSRGRCATVKEASEEEVEHAASRFPYPPDVRPPGCRAANLTDDFSNVTVSIIIPWLKEKWEHIEGSMHALLYFTPASLIEEIIFVSDGNTKTYEAELRAISDKVKVIALPTRQGLIRAKLRGVEMAKAPVLMFMEAHVIVNRDWLQPLLKRVKANPRVLAMPALDYKPADDWHAYYLGSPGHWRFEWNFNLVHTNPAGMYTTSTHEPYDSPGTSGGIFAMRKDWFLHIGSFDPEMYEWGGDHFELSMKVWRCGGKIEIVPCSRIGHLFREVATRPYTVSELQVVHNYARLAEVWGGEYRHLFYRVKPQARIMWLGDLSAQKKIPEDLKCRSMQWYLDNVDHELKWEAPRLCLWTYNPMYYWMRCKNEPPAGRSIIDEVMPAHEYLAAWRAAKAKAARDATASAVDPLWHEL